MGLTFIIIASFVDAYLYGYCYEFKLKQSENYSLGIFNNRLSEWIFNLFKPVIKFLFWEWGAVPGETWVPFYRLLVQWPLDILGLYLTWQYCGTWELAGTIGTIYFLVKEFLFYAWLGAWEEMQRYEYEIQLGKIDVYWLKRLYFAGAWYFRPYTYLKFQISFLIGLGIYIIFFIIQILKTGG